MLFTHYCNVDYFSGNNSTVNICSLDLTKAFDKMDHCIGLMYNMMMDRNIPVCYIRLLYCWYNKMFTAVKWGAFVSRVVKLSSGIRQGGILSPSLFAIFVDSVLHVLEKSKLGCFIKCECFNAFMYADDLIICAISILHLHQLI